MLPAGSDHLTAVRPNGEMASNGIDGCAYEGDGRNPKINKRPPQHR
jgi:hypothetical protein